MKNRFAFRPPIAVTMGDPVGIGPEIIVKTMARGECNSFSKPFVVGDIARLEAAKDATGLYPEIRCISDPDEGRYDKTCINVMPTGRLVARHIRWGCLTRSAAAAAVQYIEKAVALVRQGSAKAMVTCPIHKKAFKLAGVPHAGHTELIAQRTGVSNFVMMMAGSRLRVALVTIHEAFRKVPALLTAKKVFHVIALTQESLKERFGIPKPCVAVSGLNPHAGEDGRFGDEEHRILKPAIQRARQRGYLVEGPFSPDTIFNRALDGGFDAVIALYHDQGLIPFKLIHFTDGVNTTLGLPIIRTSVDHGTAYDIAGTGKAHSGSLEAAIQMAADQVYHQARWKWK